MADNVDQETRSRVMSRVRSKNTRPELALRRALWAAGIRGWRCHIRGVPGTPDLCWRGRRLAVFVDSAWWHGHPSRWTPGRHPKKWDEKIEANRARDVEVNARLPSKDGPLFASGTSSSETIRTKPFNASGRLRTRSASGSGPCEGRR